MKTLTLFLSALMLWGYSLSAAADPSCEGRFVNPITDVCWRCIFPLSLGSVQVGKGDLPDTSNPGSPLQLCPAPPPLFVRPGLAIGYWEPMAMTDVSRSPGCMVNLGGFSINLGKTGMGTARKDDKQVNGAFYHVHWYKYLQNTPAANLVEEKIEKTAISIRAVLTNYVKAIRYLQGIEKNGEPFTIRDWMRGVREDRPNGWLFISSNADTHASLKPVISMWLSIAIRGLLAMGENRNRRVWIFADELPTLHKLPDLVEILPEARKFGGCYVFGIQSYAQLEDTHPCRRH